ncbi:MAG: hypothetical protein Q4D31_08070, partial [Eubacteriales bacterium]|nr:hypothetical protein [Eubacteriales bacterium]
MIFSHLSPLWFSYYYFTIDRRICVLLFLRSGGGARKGKILQVRKNPQNSRKAGRLAKNRSNRCHQKKVLALVLAFACAFTMFA